jgi:hypothetical protein
MTCSKTSALKAIFLTTIAILLVVGCSDDNPTQPNTDPNTDTLPDPGPVYSWSPLGTGVSGNVKSLLVYDGQLIVGGRFAYADGDSVGSIAAWDDTSWTPLGTGMEGVGASGPGVSSLGVYNGNLIAGGSFSSAGGQSANCIASWNGSSWSPLADGLHLSRGGVTNVQALAPFSGQLMAGGIFDRAGTDTTYFIAAWGGMWKPVGGGFTSLVYALTVFDGELIAGGHFDSDFSKTLNSIARWTGSAWDSLRGGVTESTPLRSNDVRALVVYHDALIAAGQFDTAGEVGAHNIAAWADSTWTPLGSGLDGIVYALTVYEDQLIAAGDFSTAGGVAASNIAAWDGSAWSPVGNGVNERVDALAVYNDRLIAGGYFFLADTLQVGHIAAWGLE